MSCRSLTEYELMNQVQPEKYIPDYADLEPELALFRKHFLLMNALYQLQEQLLPRQYYLAISPLEIRLLPVSDPSGDALELAEAETALRHYYLDWCHYDETGAADVQALLGSFWRRYHAGDQRQSALAELGLDENAGSDEIRCRYRELAGQHHPDKGGDHQTFIGIRQAYERLMKS